MRKPRASGPAPKVFNGFHGRFLRRHLVQEGAVFAQDVERKFSVQAVRTTRNCSLSQNTAHPGVWRTLTGAVHDRRL